MRMGAGSLGPRAGASPCCGRLCGSGGRRSCRHESRRPSTPLRRRAGPSGASGSWTWRTAGRFFELNPDRFFVPASNTKLFTTALALTRLGAGYRFDTRAAGPRARRRRHGHAACGWWAAATRTSRRAPSLTARGRSPAIRWPPSTTWPPRWRRAACGACEGDIVGDDTAYVWAPYPEGWAMDDPIWEYGAPVSALTVNDNAFSLSIRPGERAGDPARLALYPAAGVLPDRQPRPHRGRRRRRISVDREPGSRQLRLWGVIPPREPGRRRCWASTIRRSMRRARWHGALERRGVTVTGTCRVRHLFPTRWTTWPTAPRLGRSRVSNWPAGSPPPCSKICGSPPKSARTCMPS